MKEYLENKDVYMLEKSGYSQTNMLPEDGHLGLTSLGRQALNLPDVGLIPPTQDWSDQNHFSWVFWVS